MEFDQEFEYEQDYPYVDDEEITEQYPTDEEDYNWLHFCQGCGFAILDCVCVHNDGCPTCGDDIADRLRLHVGTEKTTRRTCAGAV